MTMTRPHDHSKTSRAGQNPQGGPGRLDKGDSPLFVNKTDPKVLEALDTITDGNNDKPSFADMLRGKSNDHQTDSSTTFGGQNTLKIPPEGHSCSNYQQKASITGNNFQKNHNEMSDIDREAGSWTTIMTRKQIRTLRRNNRSLQPTFKAVGQQWKTSRANGYVGRVLPSKILIWGKLLRPILIIGYNPDTDTYLFCRNTSKEPWFDRRRFFLSIGKTLSSKDWKPSADIRLLNRGDQETFMWEDSWVCCDQSLLLKLNVSEIGSWGTQAWPNGDDTKIMDMQSHEMIIQKLRFNQGD